jgi:ketosteroid isomerase-like protein
LIAYLVRKYLAAKAPDRHVRDHAAAKIADRLVAHRRLDQYDGPIEFEFRDLVIAAGATFGYSHELQRVSGTLRGGQRAAFWLRVTDVYRKIGGQWRVVHEHVSVPTT